MQEAEKILQIERNIAWLPQPNEGRIVLSTQPPPQELTATALVLAFAGDHLLQTRLSKRGWDIIGGHIEPGETQEEAARREAYEEAAARLGPLHMLGYQRLQVSGPKPAFYSHPYPLSYQLFYWASIEALDDFTPTEEALERGLFAPAEALELQWVQAHRELYLAALSFATS